MTMMKLTAPAIVQLTLTLFLLSICTRCAAQRDDYEHPISFLDGDSMRSMYRSFRDFAMRIIGQTGRRTRGTFLQDTDTKFPCNRSDVRSAAVPSSVHRLKPGKLLRQRTGQHRCQLFYALSSSSSPFFFVAFLKCIAKIGDIDVIAALGDSLTAASGASSVRVTDLVIENRGLSWSIGGQWSFKNSTTLPNILKGADPPKFPFSESLIFSQPICSVSFVCTRVPLFRV